MPNSPSRLAVDPADLVSDKRRGRRQPLLEAPATLFDESAPFLSPGYSVRVNDISLAGIGFKTDKQLPIGSTHRIHLVTKEIRVNSRVSVSRCKKGKAKGEYEVGCEFIED
ncbi:MAG TPA: PilZ domain-containing protein [Tepidisphaeraceae bacterium]|nr:PilZ domain-containing protein [Tepidisphaeraceae bacterium]